MNFVSRGVSYAKIENVIRKTRAIFFNVSLNYVIHILIMISWGYFVYNENCAKHLTGFDDITEKLLSQIHISVT